MSVIVRALAVTDREELGSLLEANLSALDPGLSLLDRHFPAGEAPVDLLALDAGGRLVLCLLGSGSNAAVLVRALEAYGWCRENGTLLRRLFPAARIDTEAPPRLYLLAPRFSDGLRRTARHFGPLSPALVECRCLEVNGARAICLERVEGMPIQELQDAPGGEPDESRPEISGGHEGAVPARAREFARRLERLSFREAFREAGSPARVTGA